MRLLATLRSFLAAFVLRRRIDRDLEQELSFHVDERARDLMARGLSPADAARRARTELGDSARWRVEAREARGLRLVDELAIDGRIAVTAVVRSPAHSLAAIAVIAIGLTAMTQMAAELNAAFWRKLPVRSPESLRMLVWSSPRTGFLNTPAFAGPHVDGAPTYSSFSYPVYKAIRDDVRPFSDVACWMDPGETLPVVMGDLGLGSVQFVSGNSLSMLGVPTNPGPRARTRG